jgi:hypothetical protein
VNEVVLEFCQRCEDAKYEPACRRRRIDIAGQDLKSYPTLLQIAD